MPLDYTYRSVRSLGAFADLPKATNLICKFFIYAYLGLFHLIFPYHFLFLWALASNKLYVKAIAKGRVNSCWIQTHDLSIAS